MTPAEFDRIREWDKRCGIEEGLMFGTTVDRRRLIEYVLRLQVQLEQAKRSGCNIHGPCRICEGNRIAGDPRLGVGAELPVK